MKSFYFKRFALCLSIIIGTALTSFAKNVAKIGDTEYATLAEAVAAVPVGGTETTITMLADVTGLTRILAIEAEKNVRLELSGKKIESSATAVINVSGTLTVEDSNGSGEIKNTKVGGIGVQILENGSFNLESGSIIANINNKASFAYGVKFYGDNACFNMTGGKVDGGRGTYDMKKTAKINITGGQVIGNAGISSYGNVTISGSAEITATGGNAVSPSTSCKVIIKDNAKITATNGNGVYVVGNDDGYVDIQGGTITSTTEEAVCIGTGIATVKGATLKSAAGYEQIGFSGATGYLTADSDTGYTTSADCEIYDANDKKTGWSSLLYVSIVKKGFGTSSRSVGKTLKLIKDITLTAADSILLSSTDLTLDLNGYNIIRYSPTKGPSTAIMVEGSSSTKYANVTIKGNGTIKSEDDNNKGVTAVYVSEFANLTINGGTYNVGGTDNATIYICHPSTNKISTVTIYGGNFTTPNKWVLNCNDETYKNGMAKFIVRGGTFPKEYNPSKPETEPALDDASIPNWLPEGCVVTTKEDGSFSVVSHICKIEGKDGFYDSISDALIENVANATIKMLSDTEEDVHIPGNSYITVDLNGFTITNKESDTFTVPINSSLTIVDTDENKNGKVDNVTHKRACIYNNGTVTLNGGKFMRSKEASKSMEDANGNSYYNILNHGDMTINDGVTVFSTGVFSSLIASGYFNYADTKDPRNGYVAGTNKEAPTLVVNGGMFSGGINTIKNDDNATAEIKGGTFENVTQHCVMNNNKLIVSGGTFNNTGSSVYAVWNDTYNAGVNVCEMEISGGTFNGNVYCGTKTSISNGTFNGDIKVWGSHNPEISGGTFVTDVTDYCVDGFMPIKGEDGTYTVSTGDVFVANGENGGFVSLSGDSKVLDLDHSTITKLIVNNDFDNVTVNYKRDFSENWSDLFVPFDITLTSDILAKFSFAELWDTELVNNEPTIECIVMEEGDVLSANTPYIIKANTAGEQTLQLTDVSLKKTAGVSGTLAADCASIKQTFKFYGVYENTTLFDKYGYFLNSSAQSSFYTVSDATASLSPMRFYMTVQNKADGSYYYPNGTSASAQKSIRLNVIGGGEGTTGITDVNATKAQGEQNVYTLQGTFVGKSTKGLKAGIYVVDGKKIIVK